MSGHDELRQRNLAHLRRYRPGTSESVLRMVADQCAALGQDLSAGLRTNGAASPQWQPPRDDLVRLSSEPIYLTPKRRN